MESNSRSRLMLFLITVILLAAGMQLYDNYIGGKDSVSPPVAPRVSADDLRRGVTISFKSGHRQLNNNASFISRYADKYVNLIVIDFPLLIRAGNPSYLEFDRFRFQALDELIERIHAAGMEIALNPVLTGDRDVLNAGKSAITIYDMYNEWLIRASKTRADALFIHPIELHDKIPASLVLETIVEIHEAYSGVVLMHRSPTETYITELYRKHMKGFVVRCDKPADIQAIHYELREDSTHTNILFNFHPAVSETSGMFAPFASSEEGLQRIAISSAYDAISGLERSPWLYGVLLPDPRNIEGSGGERIQYTDFLKEWYKALKRASRDRVFGRAQSL